MPSYLLALILAFQVVWINGQNLYGCSFESSVCSEEEYCSEDGLFGHCQEVGSEDITYERLNNDELELLRLELLRLIRKGYNWHSPKTQCLVTYFLMTRRHQMNYDPQFCNVKDSTTLLQLIQIFDRGYNDIEEAAAITGKSPIELLDENEQLREGAAALQAVNEEDAVEDYPQMDLEKILSDPQFNEQNQIGQDNAGTNNESVQEQALEDVVRELMNVPPRQIRSQQINLVEPSQYDYGDYQEFSNNDNLNEYSVTGDDEKFIIDSVSRIMEGEDVDFSGLSREQLDKLIVYVKLVIDLLTSMSQYKQEGATEGEIESPLALDPDQEKLLLKKDEEEIKDVDNGLTNVAHHIVKGPYMSSPLEHQLHRIQGNTVYIKLNKDVDENRGKVAQLFGYLQQNVAIPNNLTFFDFNADGKELSFRVLDMNSAVPSEAYLADVFQKKAHAAPFPAEEVAAKIYKRRKDISDLMGGQTEIKETGIGESPDTVPVGQDNVILPTLVTCGVIVGVLVVVLGAYVFKNRHTARSKVKQLAADLEAQSTKAYEELCRQRMSGTGEKSGGGPLSSVISSLTEKLTSKSSKKPTYVNPTSPRSSTSSWSEEAVHSSDMDISTGHIILNYLEDHLQKEDLIEDEWSSLVAYRADDAPSFIAVDGVNLEKNRDSAVLPYDRNRVQLHAESITDYINASPVYDADPKHPVYIAAQGPMADTAADLWQMVWEQGSVVIVNLTKLAENGTNKCYRYWPENGSDIHGNYEIHLVSEHIWCEDYVVRSFYLKNTMTNETRTVTQFHFLSWPDHSTPPAPKPLLEFRRKVNKSYRGRSSPIIVHCSDGAGRTGTYILLDMVLNRIGKGVKEINVAATLEHLRDLRMKVVETKEQYEFVLTGLAEEVQAILKALPQ